MLFLEQKINKKQKNKIYKNLKFSSSKWIKSYNELCCVHSFFYAFVFTIKIFYKFTFIEILTIIIRKIKKIRLRQVENIKAQFID